MDRSASRNLLFPVLAVFGTLFALGFPSIKLALDLSAAPHLVTYDVIRVLFSVVLAIVAGATLIGGRYTALSFALYAFALSRAAQPASAWGSVVNADWTWLAAAFAAIVAGASIYGFVALCLRIPTGEAIGRWRFVERWLPVYAVVVGAVYGTAVWRPFAFGTHGFNVYLAFAALIWIGYLCGFLAYLDRRRIAVGQELLRTRWVALAIGAHVGIEATFLLLNLLGYPQAAGWLFMLNPAPFAFAYALVSWRIVDVRVFGGRAMVYAILTSVPLLALAVADWLFARRLEDAKLATVIELALAVGFSFWLQALHRRIDRFVDRTFFANRHRAHAALEKMVAALPLVERIETIDTMLVNDVREQLELTFAALYQHDGEKFARTAGAGFEGLPQLLDADDPLVLYARTSRRLVALDGVPHSRIPISSKDASPAFAVPVMGATRTWAIVLYGEHRGGEPLDAEEERLLMRLAQAAAHAYEHLLLQEREREIVLLRARIAPA
ncbi:MAG TPA: hypothetical protein VIJ12_05740 [Candidatus Baltobacteraceae bacterium]